MTQGYVHSVESMGLVDGPGIRSVVFLQGCPLRCLYCHNPDTWNSYDKAYYISPLELTKKLMRFKGYYGENGGVTLSGGEPLLQAEFAIELFSLLKEQGVHTCIDTSGVINNVSGYTVLEKLLSLTDLVLLDVKHFEPNKYKQITGKEIDGFNRFLEILNKSGVAVWVRHVVVPDLTDTMAHLAALKEYIKGNIKNVQKIELLAYHTMGLAKYEKLSIDYPLKGTPPMDKQLVKEYNEIINS